MADIENIIGGLERLVADDAAREKLLEDNALCDRLREACRHAGLKLERPWDTLHRIAMGSIDLPISQVGVETGLWREITKASPQAVQLDQLRKATGIEESLLLRILRYATANGMVDQVSGQSYKASNITRCLAMDGMEDTVNFCADIFPQMLSGTPKHLKQIGFKEPSDSANSPFSFVKGQPLFTWMPENPKSANDFNGFMRFQRTGLNSWLDRFLLEQYIEDGPNYDRVQFVDVAGGIGHQALTVLAKYPVLKGQVVVEDRPDVCAQHTTGDNGLRSVPFDLFGSNPIRGAKCYYLRNILHDWPDDSVHTILGHLRDAMETDSVILVDDLVIREDERHWYPSKFDITMMMALSAKERSVSEWDAVIAKAGLKRKEICHYDSYGLAIQVLVRD